MPINAVQRLRYEEMVMDILNKMLITSTRSVLWVVEALEYLVVRNKKVPKGDHVPQPIYQKAKQLRGLLQDKEMYAKEEDFPEYVTIVKDTVRSRIQELLFMSPGAIKKQINIDRRKLAESKKPKRIVSYLQPHHVSVATAEEVAIKDQWWVNLIAPMSDEQGLFPDEMASLCNLIDNEKYHWPYAMLLTANIPLAHWIASTDISELIFSGILDINNPAHLEYLTEPSKMQMSRFSLLSPILKHGLITPYDALEIELTLEDRRQLKDPALRARLQKLPLSDEDYALLSKMGILQEEQEEVVRADNVITPNRLSRPV